MGEGGRTEEVEEEEEVETEDEMEMVCLFIFFPCSSCRSIVF